MLDDILLFINVVNSGGFLQLSKVMNISHSTISRRVMSLENELGIQLLKRNARGIELTAKGALLYDKFHNIQQVTDKLLAPIINNNHSLNGLLHIALPQAFSRYAITPYIGELLQKHPNLNISLHFQYRSIDMVKEQFDIAIVSILPTQTTQKFKTIYKSKIIIVCSQEYAKKYGIPQTISDLLSNHLVVGARFGTEVPKIFQVFNEATDEIVQAENPKRLLMNDISHAYEMVKSSTAISGVFEESIRDDLVSGKLIRVLPKLHLGYISFYMLRSIERSDMRYVIFEKFINECIDRLNKPEATQS